MVCLVVAILILFSTNSFELTNNHAIFATWIERSCKLLDKGKLTALPHFSFGQHNLKVSAMLRFEELPKVNSERWLSLEDFEGEVWKDVGGYESKYQVSNYGRVKSKRRIRKARNNGFAFVSSKVIKLQLHKGRGDDYLYVTLYDLNKTVVSKNMFVHRLVADAFIPNFNNYPQINHKDENPLNNTVFVDCDGSVNFKKSNIEWCTSKYNNNYGNKMERTIKSMIKCGASIPVVEIDKQGNVLKQYQSLNIASKELKTNANRFAKKLRRGVVQRNGKFYKLLE